MAIGDIDPDPYIPHIHLTDPHRISMESRLWLEKPPRETVYLNQGRRSLALESTTHSLTHSLTHLHLPFHFHLI